MNLEGKRIGFVIIESFYNFKNTKEELKKIIKLGGKVLPIISENVYDSEEFIAEIEEITNSKILHTIQEVEQIGPKDMLDLLVIAPATGNIIAKLANDIDDEISTIAAKSHLRKERNIVIGISTNNGLSGAAQNIGKLLNMKNYYFVPFRQNNPITKPRSPVFIKIGFYIFYVQA